MSIAASREIPRHFNVDKEMNTQPTGGAKMVPMPRSYALTSSVNWALALLLLIPSLPLIGVLVVLIRLTSRGAAVYRQVRVGKGGRNFLMYKLRSMRIDAEARTGPTWSTGGSDSRVTPLGYWLRKLHLDEFPQLFNVLKGEMSLVGPRPERPEFVAVLAEQIPGYLERLAVLPGITGLAQVNLPPDTDLDSVRRKLVLDREYAANAGVLFDQRIILCTLFRIVGLRGGRSVQLFGLERTVILPTDKTHVGENMSTPQMFASARNVASADLLREQHRGQVART
jgi:lipopolysaccharide/colanic/teichoic acid biosynthesis glycosyltransferase